MREFNLDLQNTSQQLQAEKKKNMALEQEKEVLEAKIQEVLTQEQEKEPAASFENTSFSASPIQERIGNLIEDLDSTLQQLQKEKVKPNQLTHTNLIQPSSSNDLSVISVDTAAKTAPFMPKNAVWFIVILLSMLMMLCKINL